MYSRIIVPVTKSDYSDTASSFAFNLASAMLRNKVASDVKLVGMHIMDENSAEHKLGGVEEYKFQQIADKTLAHFEEKAQVLGLSDCVETISDWGAPAENISNYAKNTRANMIIMGEQVEQTRLNNPFMGGTSETIIRKAPCPVLISRFKCMMCDYHACYQPSVEPSAAACARIPAIRRILFPYDGSSQAKQAVKHVLQWTNTWGSDLTVLYVGHDEHVLEDLKPHLEELNIPNIDYIMEEKDSAPTVADKIVEVEKAINACLIIMGAFGDPKVKEIFIGSTTTYTIRNASCPVLLIP